jgi:hypothetical protein
MGRIIIIGNGFDLSHGLKTSYWDFMNFLLEETNVHSKRNGTCGTIHHDFNGEINPFVAFRFKDGKPIFSTCRDNPSIYFKQLYLDYNKDNKWADLESLYFKLISKNISSIENIRLINIEFSYLKELLEY